MADHHRSGVSTDEQVIEALNRLGNDMDYLKNRLSALEINQPSDVGGAEEEDRGGEDTNNASDQAVGRTGEKKDNTASRGILKWKDSMDVDTPPAEDANALPIRKIKFPSPRNTLLDDDNKQNEDLLAIHDDDGDSSSTSSTSEEAIAFSGWARCFFQARHHRSATQITSGVTATTSQDTYLYLTIDATTNELRISNTDDRWKPPLIDPPIQLKYFYAAKVPGSHSGAALFLRNDSRRLRKYIFRFEFVNRAVHQPPARYVQFIRSGKAAKRSMRGINKMKNAFNKMGEERKANMKVNDKRAQDAFAAHLGTLDELLRECDEAADRFVECVNTQNEEEELLMLRGQRELAGSGAMVGVNSRTNRRTKPLPPYWGSGFNRPSAKDDEEELGDDEVDSDSDYSEEEDELYYDDDNDDETFFDKVQVSTEQTLETLFSAIVK